MAGTCSTSSSCSLFSRSSRNPLNDELGHLKSFVVDFLFSSTTINNILNAWDSQTCLSHICCNNYQSCIAWNCLKYFHLFCWTELRIKRKHFHFCWQFCCFCFLMILLTSFFTIITLTSSFICFSCLFVTFQAEF